MNFKRRCESSYLVFRTFRIFEIRDSTTVLQHNKCTLYCHPTTRVLTNKIVSDFSIPISLPSIVLDLNIGYRKEELPCQDGAGRQTFFLVEPRFRWTWRSWRWLQIKYWRNTPSLIKNMLRRLMKKCATCKLKNDKRTDLECRVELCKMPWKVEGRNKKATYSEVDRRSVMKSRCRHRWRCLLRSGSRSGPQRRYPRDAVELP